MSELSRVRSTIAGVAWPPLSDGPAALLVAMLRVLDETQWLPVEALAARQFHQLTVAAEHWATHSMAFADRLTRAGLNASDLSSKEGLRKVPPLRRRDIQLAGDDLFCRALPAGHGPVSELRTSGSTGEPVKVRRTAINQLDWLAMTMRDHLWHKRDFGQGFCAIRANIRAHTLREDWGPPASLLFATGKSLGLPIAASLEQLAAWIGEFKPGTLLVYPNTLNALTRHCAAHGIQFNGLHHIRTIGETLHAPVREAAKATFHADVADCYTSQELGYIAIECPESGLYHVPETLIVELLDEQGADRAPGQSGRVVVTDLRNFATPLLRYDIGDYAEPADPCPCGRGLPTLARILGRERNLFVMPDGTRHWPRGGFVKIRDDLPVNQWQIVQTARESLAVRLVTERALTAAEEDMVRERVRKAIGYPFAIQFQYFSGRIPAGPGGKFEEFLSTL